MKRKLVLHIPHSSVDGIFDGELGKWPRNAFFANQYVKMYTDWFTDMLFHTDEENVREVVFPYSRFVCDVERLENDPLEEIGQGIIYTEYGGYKRRLLTESQRDKILSLRESHLNTLKSHLAENCLLIDCHSFSNNIPNAPDVCIGFNDDWSYSGLVINGIAKEFEKSGYSVRFNSPYSNSIAPKMPFEYKSVMIEVNKRVYMDESSVTLNTNPRQWMRWYGCLDRIYGLLSRED